eukprot:6184486-Pleurochrysis_carterae.AAC.1
METGSQKRGCSLSIPRPPYFVKTHVHARACVLSTMPTTGTYGPDAAACAIQAPQNACNRAAGCMQPLAPTPRMAATR